MNKRYEKLTLKVVFLVQVLLCQGCNVIGFLVNPTSFEQKIPAECKLKDVAEQKVFIWVEPLPGSGANSESAGRLSLSIGSRLKKNAGISPKYILMQNALTGPAPSPFQSPAEIGRQVGAGFVLYVRLEEFSVINLHSDKIYSGQMKTRAFLINSQNGEVVCPKEKEGIVAELVADMTTQGRDDITSILNDAAAHCIVRRFYPCPKNEYQVNEERSTLNEMIRQEVY